MRNFLIHFTWRRDNFNSQSSGDGNTFFRLAEGEKTSQAFIKEVERQLREAHDFTSACVTNIVELEA